VSQKPGPQGCNGRLRRLPARTPGPLGVRDAAQPGALAELGDTPGPLGRNDGAQRQADGAYSLPKSKVILIDDVD
jgi:hypothetical protein